MRNFFFDSLQQANQREFDSRPVVVADIDDNSLAEVGQWPWPRTVLAKLVTRLVEDGAIVIGFDMIFAEHDRFSPRALAEAAFPEDTDLKQKLSAAQDNDEVFAKAIKNAKVVLGRAVRSDKQGGDKVDGGKIPSKVSIATIGGDPRDYLLHYADILPNLPVLENAATGLGMLTVKPERDGLIRRAPLLLSAGQAILPAMAVELLRISANARTLVVKRDEAGVRSIAFAGAEIPADRDGQLWISFTRHDPQRFISAADVLAGRAPRDRIEGKIAIVGASATGLFDLKSTPLERSIPGVEIHAQIIESILNGSTLNRPNFAPGLEITIAVALGLVFVIAAPIASALLNLLIGAMIALVLIAASWYLFTSYHMLLDLSYPLLTSFFVFILMTFMNYLREEKRKTQIRSAFQQYLAPEFVEQLVREPERLVLGGETRDMTILFSDVRGFTTIAETFRDNPAGLTALMNRILTALSYPIIKRQGTIDKYIGDAIMAFWNAPLNDPGHALNACEAALDLLRELDRLNVARRQEAQKSDSHVRDIQIGIGISTGLSVVGNMGSDIRFNYSVLGDCVNLASRLESLTSFYGMRILIASETARRCAGRLALIEVDRVRVKGRRDPETIYAVLGRPELSAEDRFVQFKSVFDDLLLCYRSGDWEAALKILPRCRTLKPSNEADKLLEIYATRLVELEANPPKGWDGVFDAPKHAS